MLGCRQCILDVRLLILDCRQRMLHVLNLMMYMSSVLSGVGHDVPTIEIRVGMNNKYVGSFAPL